jgi:hypothetical protein
MEVQCGAQPAVALRQGLGTLRLQVESFLFSTKLTSRFLQAVLLELLFEISLMFCST